MISQNPYSNCMSARLYYHDFLSEETREGIPESALKHIIDCPDCRAEIDRLAALFEHVDNALGDQQSRRNSAIVTLLKFHFTYVGEPVTCSRVKPFLASLADPVLQILIPTPITKHIDECPSCRANLHTLQDLHLTHKQLCRLGQLLAEEPPDEAVSCSQARAAIPAVASMVFRETNAEILKHLSTCPACREELLRHREALRQELLDGGADRDAIPCQAVSPSDIYDYAFPYGIDPADDEYTEFREPLASHLGGCPTCLAKVQELQNTIWGIADRPESDVVTVYHVDEPVAAGTDEGADHARPRSTIKFTARLKQSISSPKVKPWLKIGAVAAVILIGLTVMINVPTATALTLDRMDRAIKKARNLHISAYSGHEAELTRETWLSRSLGFYMLKNMNRFDLSDFTNKLQKIRQLDSNSVVKKELPDGAQAAIERNIAVYLNILPFSPMSDERKGSNWSRMTNKDRAVANQSGEVYELAWIDKTYSGSLVYYKRRYFVDPETSLPNKTEFYRKSPGTDEYTLQSKMVIELLSDNEMQAAVKNAFP